MNKIGAFLSRLVVFILFGMAGMMLGFAVTGYWVNLENSGMFVQWKLLDSPLKFQQFVYSNESEIWGYAENGRFYMYKTEFCQDTPGEACGKWIELDPHGKFVPEIKNVIGSGCKAVYDYYLVESRYPPQTEASPLECMITQVHHPFFGTTGLTYYVLLDNGQVWMWKHKPDLINSFKITVYGTLAGLLAGILAWWLLKEKLFRFFKKLVQPLTRQTGYLP